MILPLLKKYIRTSVENNEIEYKGMTVYMMHVDGWVVSDDGSHHFRLPVDSRFSKEMSNVLDEDSVHEIMVQEWRYRVQIKYELRDCYVELVVDKFKILGSHPRESHASKVGQVDVMRMKDIRKYLGHRIRRDRECMDLLSASWEELLVGKREIGMLEDFVLDESGIFIPFDEICDRIYHQSVIDMIDKDPLISGDVPIDPPSDEPTLHHSDQSDNNDREVEEGKERPVGLKGVGVKVFKVETVNRSLITWRDMIHSV